MQFSEGKCKILFKLSSTKVQDGGQLANGSYTEVRELKWIRS